MVERVSIPDPEAAAPTGGLFEELSAAADAASTAPDQGTPESAGSRGERLARAARGRKEPASKTARVKTATTVREPASKPGEFVEALTPIYTAIGVAVSFRDRDGICGPAIVSNAEKCAIAWDELAQKDPAVRRALRTMTRGSAWGAVIAAHGGIALAIAAAHGPMGMVPMPMPEDNPADYAEPAPRSAPMSDDARRTRTEPQDINWSPGD